VPAHDQQGPPVMIHPPILLGGAILGGLLLDYCLPRHRRGLRLPDGARRALAAGLVAGGGTFVALAMIELARAGTSAPTFKPSTALVTRGIYARTRNPIYLGALLVYPGLALFFTSPGMLLLWPVVMLVLEQGVVRREERYLERLFGEAYRRYRARVARWL
jgi:protein-S-isoprenylcysteine O-methyltransferase Ste14